MLLLCLHHIDLVLLVLHIHIEILMFNVRHLLLINPSLTHHVHITWTELCILMPTTELIMVPIHHILVNSILLFL